MILVAAFTLDRRLLVATAALCLGSVLVVAELERSGALRTTFAGRLGWEPFADVAIILVVTAVAVHILLADAARGVGALRGSERRRRRQPRASRRTTPSSSASPTSCRTT